MTSKKTVSWSAQVNLGNDEFIGLVVTDEVKDKDDARDIFAFACGQLLGVAKGADEKTARLLQDFVSRFVQEEEAKPAVRDEKEPTVKLEAPPAKEPWIPKITKSSWEKAQVVKAEKQDAAAAIQEEVLAIESRVAGATERPHPDAKPEQAKAPAPQPAPSAPPTPEASTVATAPDAPQSAPTAPPKMGSGAVCEKCGAEVSDAQKNLSQLFTNKTLCKTCLEAP